MKALPNLIRMKKWKLEEQQRVLSELESLKSKFMARIEELDAEVAAESKNAGDSPETGHVLGGFIQASLLRRRHLEESVGGVQQQIEEVREGVAEAFQELKRFELAQERQRQRESKAAGRRERVEEDELGINMFRRRRDAGAN